jgi:hypothetical protein
MHGSNVHFIFLRLHSQQLCVPLRTFLRLTSDGTTRDVVARGEDIVSGDL